MSQTYRLISRPCPSPVKRMVFADLISAEERVHHKINGKSVLPKKPGSTGQKKQPKTKTNAKGHGSPPMFMRQNSFSQNTILMAHRLIQITKQFQVSHNPIWVNMRIEGGIPFEYTPKHGLSLTNFRRSSNFAKGFSATGDLMFSGNVDPASGTPTNKGLLSHLLA